MTGELQVSDIKYRFPNLVTRFAPSPTGHLHLGHVASALYVWGIATCFGVEKVWLRIEDHDRGRYRAEFEASILRDLAWLRFHPTNATPAGSRDAPTWRVGSDFRQSECHPFYEEALLKLIATGRVYGCDCSRKRIAQTELARATDIETNERPYDGFCRERRLPLKADGIGLRLRLEDCDEQFDDLLLGKQRQNPAKQCGDLLLKDRLGQWTYHFAVVVDDQRQGVNLIIRGQDLTESTGRQLQLARLLGYGSRPLYLHHPLLKDQDGKKLSKRFFSAAIGVRRQAGESAAAILGDAAWRLGLTSGPGETDIKDVVARLRPLIHFSDDAKSIYLENIARDQIENEGS